MNRVSVLVMLILLLLPACPEPPMLDEPAGAIEIRNYSAYPITAVHITPEAKWSWGANLIDAPIPAGSGWVVPCEVYPNEWPPRAELAVIEQFEVFQETRFDVKIETGQPHPGWPTLDSVIRFEQRLGDSTPFDFREPANYRIDIYGAHEGCDRDPVDFAWAWVFDEDGEIIAAAATNPRPPLPSRDGLRGGTLWFRLFRPKPPLAP